MPNTSKSPRPCPSCRKAVLRPATIRHEPEVRYEGKTYTVVIDDLPVEQCEGCKEPVFTLTTDDRIDVEFRRVAGLLTAADIHRGRKQLGLTQGDLAKLLGVAKATVCRWERRTLVQSRASDRQLRVFFHDAGVRELLKRMDTDPSIGKGGEALDDPPAPLLVEATFDDESPEPVMPEERPLPVNRIARKFPRLLHDMGGEASQYVEYIRKQECLLEIK